MFPNVMLVAKEDAFEKRLMMSVRIPGQGLMIRIYFLGPISRLPETNFCFLGCGNSLKVIVRLVRICPCGVFCQ